MKTLTYEEREKYNISPDLENLIKKELIEGAEQGLTYGYLLDRVSNKFDLNLRSNPRHPVFKWVDELQAIAPSLNKLTDREKRIVNFALHLLSSNWEDEGQYFDQEVELTEEEIEEVTKKLFPFDNI